MDFARNLFGGSQKDHEDFANRYQQGPRAVSDEEAAARYQQVPRTFPLMSTSSPRRTSSRR